MENSTLLKTPNVGRISESVLEKLTDKDILSLCQKYGTEAILWKRKFIGLLPEVDRRRLYEKKKCSSVYEFAAKFGGVTNEQVKRVISIDKKLEENGLTELREKLVNGEVSLHKLVRVVSVANGENEAELLRAVTKLSKSAVETLVRDEKNNQMAELLGDDGWDCGLRGLSEGVNSCEDTFVPGHKQDYEMNNRMVQVGDPNGNMNPTAGLRDLQALGLDLGVIARLRELKMQGYDINKLLNEVLDKREMEIEKEVDEVGREVREKEEVKREDGEEVGRYVPAKVRSVVEKRGGTKCEVSGCLKEAKHLHHTIRFGIQKSHDPRYVVQLCAEHHQITHVMDGVYIEKRRSV